jgi:hypothetical protein
MLPDEIREGSEARGHIHLQPRPVWIKPTKPHNVVDCADELEKIPFKL